MRRHDFSPLFLILALVLGLALFFMCGFHNWGVGFAHVTKAECDTLHAACMSRVVPGMDPVPTPQPPDSGPPSDTKPDWKCYLDRYKDLRVRPDGKNFPYSKAWADRHYKDFGKREGRIFGCSQETGAVAPILWKPVSESRGGRLVVLLPANWARPSFVNVNDEICSYVDVDGHNGGRHHYWCSKPGARYPQNTILTAGGKRYLVPSPSQRYESLRETLAVTGKKPWNHSHRGGSFGTSVNLCEQYSAKSVSLDGTEWRYHRRDNGREVWYDPQMRDGLSGTITVVLKNGTMMVAELEPGHGIIRSGDC